MPMCMVRGRNFLVYLEEDDQIMGDTKVKCTNQLRKQSLDHEKVWKLYFYGVYSMEANGTGVLLLSLEGNLIPLSFKLEFEATHNVVEYEALLLWLQATKNLNIGCLNVFGDSKLVVKKIKNQCQTNHPRLWGYRNKVWDLVEFFS